MSFMNAPNAISVNELFVFNYIFFPNKGLLCLQIAFHLWLNFPTLNCQLLVLSETDNFSSSHVTEVLEIRWKFSSTRFDEDVLTRNRRFRDRYLNPHYCSFSEKRGNHLKYNCSINWNVTALIKRGNNHSFFAAFYYSCLGFNALLPDKWGRQ